MWKEKVCRLIIFIFALFSISCQKSEEGNMKTLKINFQEGDLPSLHPHDLMIYLRGISIAKSLYEGLTRIGPDGKPHLAGAESITADETGLKYTITLRESRWSDGSPILSSQYEQSWKQALSPTSTCSRANLLYFLKNGEEAKKGLVPLSEVGVYAKDDQTLILELAYPCPFLHELLTHSVCYPLRHPEEKQVTIFNGPFVVSEWRRGELLRLQANPQYWNKKNVSLAQIDVSMMQDPTTAFTAFQNKEIDWMGVPLCNLTVEQIGQLRQEGTLLSHPVDRAFWVFLNTQHPAFTSPSIRKALSLAIDRSTITQHILVGGQPLKKAFPETLLPGNGHPQLTLNLQKAQQLFEQGLQELKLTRESFPPFSISYAQQANRKQLAEFLRETWSRAFGIDVRVDSQEWNVLRANLDKGLFEVTGCFEAAFYKDPIEVMERFVTRNPGNFAQWVHPTFSTIVTTAKKEANPARRQELMAKAEAILADEMPFIPICGDKLLFSHRKGLTGYAFDYVGAIDLSFAKFTP